jgi:3,4-dihydroxy-2-butanone 4-phosphate synthase
MNVFHDYISELPDVIEDARNGRMFILVDAEDRENEGRSRHSGADVLRRKGSTSWRGSGAD